MNDAPKTQAGKRGKRLKLEDYLPYRLTVATGWVTRLIAGIYAERFDLNIAQWRVIALLGDEGPMTQQQIAQRSTMDKISTHRAARALLERDIIRISATVGGRYKFLELTSTGRKIHGEIAPLALELETKIFERAGVTSHREFHQQLKNIELAARDMHVSIVGDAAADGLED